MGWFEDNTPKITINNMTVSQVSKAVKAETACLKISKLLSALVTGIISIICCIYFMNMWQNTKDVQEHCLEIIQPMIDSGRSEYLNVNSTVWCSNSTVYDWGFNYTPYANWTDYDETKNYWHLLLQCDTECWTSGTHWSNAFALLGIAFMLMSIQSLVLALGVWVFPSRLVGLLCQTCCQCYVFGALITVTIYRFNSMGELASLSNLGSSVKQEAQEDGTTTWVISDDTTYAGDGQKLFNLWLVAILFMVPQCLLNCFAAAPPTQDKLRKLGFNFNEEVNEDGQQVVRAVL